MLCILFLLYSHKIFSSFWVSCCLHSVVYDYYDYQVNHGKEVIGIGRDFGVANFHNNSQGRNMYNSKRGRSKAFFSKF